MKSKFLGLVEEVKELGLVEALYKTSNKEELSSVWKNFWSINKVLSEKIHDWADDFKKYESEPIFDMGETIENPMEVAAILSITSDDEVTEDDIFEDCSDFENGLKDEDHDLAKTVADILHDCYIEEISAEDIFPD